MSSPNLWLNHAGSVVNLDETRLDPAVAANIGWVRASDSQVKDYNDSKKFGSTGQQLATFGEGAAQALSFGLSTHLEKALGINPEDIQKREQYNPWAHGLGTAAGIAVPMLIPGVGEATAPGMIAKMGRLVESGATGALEASGLEGASLAGRIAKEAVSKGLGSSIETAAFQTGQVVHENALGNPHISASAQIQQIGLAGLLGLGGGAILGGAAPVMEKYVASGKQALKDYVSARSPAAKAKAVVDGYNEANKLVSAGFEKVLPEQMKLLDAVPIDAAKTEASRITSKLAETAQNMMADPDIYETATAKPMMRIVDGLAKRVENATSSGEVYNELTKSRQLLDDLRNYGKRFEQMGPAERNTAQALDPALREMRQSLRSENVWGETGARVGEWNDAYSEFKPAKKEFEKYFGRKVQDEIRIDPKKLSSLENPNNAFHREAFQNFHQAADKFLELNDEWAQKIPGSINLASEESKSILNKSSQFLGDQIKHGTMYSALQKLGIGGHDSMGLLGLGAVGHMIGGPIGAGVAMGMKAVTTAPKLMEILGTLERNNEGAMANVAQLAAKAVKSGGFAAKGVGAELRARSAAESAKLFADRAEQIKQFNSPELAQNILAHQVRGWSEHAPNTAQALQLALARTTSYLNSRLPQQTQPGPLAPQFETSPSQQANYNKIHDVVENPNLLLQYAAAGRLTPQLVQAVEATHPDWINHMRAVTLNQIAGAKGKISPQAKQQLGIFLNQDLDGTHSPMAIMTSQRLHNPPPPPQPPNPVGRPRGTTNKPEKLTVADRTQLPVNNPTQGE